MIIGNNKIKIGITGQNGFIGTHLYNTIGLLAEQFERIEFQKSFFSSPTLLDSFTSQCDVIVHLAALNRHNDSEIIYTTNIDLVSKIIASCNRTNSQPHILFSSSTQEEKDNLYGKSKKEGRLLFENWAQENNAIFSGLIIPNVFGAFGNPFYNSVVATFCYQLTHNETPKIEIDGDLKLIYIENLVKLIIEQIQHPKGQINNINILHNYEIKVSLLLDKLMNFKSRYYEKGEIPDLNNELDRNLFITFLTYIDHKSFFPFKLKMNTDNRGSFVETIKLGSGGQISFSTTIPGITRGNHYHTRKAERFAVIRGKAQIELRRINTSEILSFELNGNEPSFVDMPIWYTHNIKNIGEDYLYTIFWINEFFDSNDPDTYFENV